MAKALITADVHFGLPGKLDDTLWAMRTIHAYALENNIDVIIILGDLFHDRTSINIGVLNEVYKFFETTKKMGQQWIVFPGNHDMFLKNSWDIHSLVPLKDHVTVIEEPKLLMLDDHRFWVLPFVHYESAYLKILSNIEDFHQDGDVLLTHIGVNNAKLNECFLVKHWSSVQFEESKFDRVFAGHFHCHQQVTGRGNVWYPGSPIPYRFDEGAVTHGFIEYDLDSRDVKFIDIRGLKLAPGSAPDYITILEEDVGEAIDLEGNHIRVLLDKDYSRDDLQAMREGLLNSGALSVKMVRTKDSSIEPVQANSTSRYDTPQKLFEKWLEHDQPDGYDVDLLRRLNQEIVSEVDAS
jgi:exonuclease SbcD